MSFHRLIRFLDEDGQEKYGDVKDETPVEHLEGSVVPLLTGNIKSGFHKSDQNARVAKLLSPLPETPIIICAGVNYKSHAKETKFPPPKKPVIFATPPDRLAGPFDDIHIHPDAQELLDYEGELSVVIGKDAYDVSEEEALDYVLGYTVGNDVSARSLHAPDVSGYQMGYAKSFDKFGPIGPYVVSPTLVSDPQILKLTTYVNGDVRQSSDTSQMIWSCTIIMTGTPEGVGWHTNGCLKDGDVVKVEIGQLGYIQNKMVFQKKE
ncbi:hypothetical protein K4K60_012657 [Colletotrichum sp. SAR11_57]|nr:Fumarylacetoacetate hydrolase domain-containing protein 2 [Colletotrichum fructicola]KAI8287310.1 hypothetical protein K4K60_012657 [Colletotrichum sp. SAR11_57]